MKRKGPRFEEDLSGFRERMVEIRKAKGFTQDELGQAVGISQRAMSYYENECSRPPAHLLPKFAAALGVTIDELLGVKKVKANGEETSLRLIRRLKKIEKLPASTQKAVLKVIDDLIQTRGNV